LPPLTSIHPALILLFLAGWVHRDISTGNIIVVEDDDGGVRGFLSDLEYAKEMSNESSSSDPKTVCFNVKDRRCLTLDQGAPYFMPLEIHLGKMYANISKNTQDWSRQEEEQDMAYLDNILLHRSNPPRTIVRYKYNHDLESLMWVALYIVFGLVNWEAAQETWPKIFVNSLRPSDPRRDFFTEEESPLQPEFIDAFHNQLLPGFPTSFELIRKHLWSVCRKSEPEKKDYHHLFNRLIGPFDRLLRISKEKASIVYFVEQSGQANVEVDTSQNVTTKRKIEDTDKILMRVRTFPPIKRARSSPSVAAGKTAGKAAGQAKERKQ